MEIKVNKIIPQTVECFNPNGASLGFLNQYEFNDLLIQINNNRARGFFLVYNEEKIHIDNQGTLQNYPAGLFDLITNQLLQLV